MNYAPYYTRAGYRHGMAVRVFCGALWSAGCTLAKFAAVMTVLLLPYLADALFDYLLNL